MVGVKAGDIAQVVTMDTILIAGTILINFVAIRLEQKKDVLINVLLKIHVRISVCLRRRVNGI